MVQVYFLSHKWKINHLFMTVSILIGYWGVIDTVSVTCVAVRVRKCLIRGGDAAFITLIEGVGMFSSTGWQYSTVGFIYFDEILPKVPGVKRTLHDSGQMFCEHHNSEIRSFSYSSSLACLNTHLIPFFRKQIFRIWCNNTAASGFYCDGEFSGWIT